MNEDKLSFFRRMSLAFSVFSRILSDSGFAASVLKLGDSRAASPPASAKVSKPPSFGQAPPDSALQLLGLLQQEGRLIDFLKEDVAAFSDADIGTAARVVHEGCRKVLQEHFSIVPVRVEDEGSRVVLSEGFDASSIKLTGNVAGRPPFRGALVHRGWRVEDVNLPKIAEGHDTRILAAAEVEL